MTNIEVLDVPVQTCTGQRKATVIKKDGVELTRSFERFVLNPGTLDESDNLVDNPLSKNLMVQLILQMKSKQYAMLFGQHAVKMHGKQI